MQNDFVHRFLFDEADLIMEDEKRSVPMVMDASKEGWVGIPHGGIGMGAIVELANDFAHCTCDNDLKYPVQCSFRMGGSEVRVGDAVTVEAVPTGSGISGRVIPEGSETPYITAEIGCGVENPEPEDGFREYIPENFSRLSGRLEHIPYYLNCFVCGVNRSAPGLKRQFHLWESPHGSIACAFSGFNTEDPETIHRFSRKGWLHPITQLAVLDETMGWGGFLAFANGGVSVRLNFTLLRKIGVDEKIVFFGRGEKVKGKIDKRMFFWASGCGAVVRDDGALEVVTASSGQWYALKSLTDQMENELIPKEQTQKIFAIAQTVASCKNE
ncbi:hypothetical protein Dole_1311 [Desulfosudis oleivorans Hxd3]|uniref:Uncharacterized protein n=2 Tax=Desulfosudis TaxID=2904716 RepID=A8ZYB0_DESOH|nr:hypothetical protein Dole_1311 [Desulfosudis oleivorans Hxd3]